ncbi:MAG: hypothetical protein PHW46_00470 [Candidatus Omnitrophica bacterium]|nr:hypothetical protein [Candidatus Omnitrophota bacterium]
MSKKIGIFLLSFILFFNCVFISVYAAQAKKEKYVKMKRSTERLMEIGEAHGNKIKELANETGNYKKIKTAVDRNELKKGESAESIIEKYGRSVVTVNENGATIKRWVYKPGDASYFSGEKVYLFFDEKEALIDWRFVPAKEEKKEIVSEKEIKPTESTTQKIKPQEQRVKSKPKIKDRSRNPLYL